MVRRAAGTVDEQLALGVRRAAPRTGRIRRDLDREAATARRQGATLSPGLLAALRDLAEQLDAAHEHVTACRAAGREPPVGLLMAARGLFTEYRETHARVFAAGGERDPLAVLAEAIGAASVGDATDPG